MGHRVTFSVHCDMSDRKGSAPVFYSHWGSLDAKKTLCRALEKAKRTDRLDEADYFARILFCHMLDSQYNDPNEALFDSISFGITSEPNETIQKEPLSIMGAELHIAVHVDKMLVITRTSNSYQSLTFDEYLEYNQ